MSEVTEITIIKNVHALKFTPEMNAEMQEFFRLKENPKTIDEALIGIKFDDTITKLTNKCRADNERAMFKALFPSFEMPSGLSA